MRYKWLFVAIFLLILPTTTYAAERVLLIDNTEERSEDSLLFETTIRSYHEAVDVKNATTAVDLYNYEAIFLFNEQRMRLPDSLEEELLTFRGKVIVVGEAPETEAFWKEWTYDGQVDVLSLFDEPVEKPVSILNITPPSHARVLVNGERYGVTHPYIVKAGREYAVASTHVEGLRQLALNDLLAHLFPIAPGQEAFIRLTDINVNTDVEQLESITAYLQEKKIPVLLTVDSKLRTTAKQSLKDHKSLLELLRKLQSEGARIIVKTSTLYDDRDIRALTQLGLYPIGVEVEKPSMNRQDYEGISQYASLYFEPAKSTHPKHLQHILPITLEDRGAFTLYPNTINFIEGDDGSYFDAPDYQIDVLNKLSTSLLSLSYRSYLDVEVLQSIIEKIESLPYVHWIEWDKQHLVTQTDTEKITFCEDGTIKVDTHRPFYNKVRYVWESKSTDTILWLLVLFVLTFVLLFTAYIIFMRVRLRKRLFNERK